MTLGKKKLLIIHSSDELYGSDRILLEVVEALRERWNVEVWLPTDHQDGEQRLSQELARRDICVKCFDLPILRRALLNIRGFTRFARLAPNMLGKLRASQADRVYLMTGACLLFAPIARLAGIRNVTVHFQEPWGKKESLLLRQLARFADHKIAISKTVLLSTKLSAEKVNIVTNAVPHLMTVVSSESPLLAVESVDKPSYLVASRWNGHKGHETLIRAWEEAAHPGILYILGSPPQGSDRVDIEELVRKFVSKPDSIRIVGQVDNPHEWFSAVDAIILPTDTVEGFGLVAIEAFRHGKAAIVSDSGGPAEVVTHQENGLVFPPKNIKALATILRSTTKEQLRLMGSRGRETYEKYYTPERFCEAIRSELAGQEANL